MKAVVLTADSGQSDPVSGKTHALGLGWTWVQAPTTAPMAVVVIITFDSQGEAEGPHKVILSLIDESKEAVAVFEGGDPVSIETQMNLERKPGITPEAPAVAPFVVNIGPNMPLEPNRRYRWQVTVDDTTDVSWSATFLTVPPEEVPQPPREG